jgi:hypothetical protein
MFPPTCAQTTNTVRVPSKDLAELLASVAKRMRDGEDELVQDPVYAGHVKQLREHDAAVIELLAKYLIPNTEYEFSFQEFVNLMRNGLVSHGPILRAFPR